MTDSSREGVPLSHALGIGTLGQPPRARPSLNALAARVLANARGSVPLSHAIRNGTMGQAVATTASPEGPTLAEWDADDWRAFFEEKAGIAEYDNGLSRAEAEARAFETAINQWLSVNPPRDPGPDICIGCNGPLGRPGEDGMPVLAGECRHVWVHHICHALWMAKRQAEAAKALAAMGVRL